MPKAWIRGLGVLVCALISLAAARPVSAGMSTYLSFGDSLAFGETDFSGDPSFATDRGYVGPFAAFLGSQAGGVQPHVVNLAIVGETTTSFTTGAGRVGVGYTDAFLAGLNLNYYGLTPLPTQEQLLQTVAANEALAGRSIDNVTISLGSNDLFMLAASSDFQTADQGGQQVMLYNTLAQIGANYAALVGEVRFLAPSARVFLLSSYDPFPANPANPLTPLAALAVPGLNATISQVAALTNSTFVDIYPVFVGREAELTYMANSDNVHPNARGYEGIARVLETSAQVVPEPSTLSALAAGTLSLLAALGRRRARGSCIGRRAA